MLNNTELEM